MQHLQPLGRTPDGFDGARRTDAIVGHAEDGGKTVSALHFLDKREKRIGRPVDLVKVTAITLQAKRKLNEFFFLIVESGFDSSHVAFCQGVVVVKAGGEQVRRFYQAGRTNEVGYHLVCGLPIDVYGGEQGAVSRNFLAQPGWTGCIEEHEPMEIRALLPGHRGHAILLEKLETRGEPLRLQAEARRCEVTGGVESGQEYVSDLFLHKVTVEAQSAGMQVP